VNSHKKDHYVEAVRQEFSRASEYAAEYTGRTPIAHFFNTRLKRVNDQLAVSDAGRILDVGCGPGKIGTLFRNRPIEYHGIDISEHMLAQSSAEFARDPHYRFFMAKAECLPFRDGSYDTVLCLGAFEYIPDGLLALRELARVVKHGGTIILSMHNPFSPYRAWSRYGIRQWHRIAGASRRLLRYGRDEQRAPRLNRVFRIYPEAVIRHLLQSAGVLVEDVVYYDFNLCLEPLDRMVPAASVRISENLEFLGRSSLRFLGSGFIVKGKKL
jgi:ubiquinone/menaquinone biosynthesis C-methylase UbiE